MRNNSFTSRTTTRSALTLLALCVTHCAFAKDPSAEEVAYTAVIHERADKIVAELKLSDADRQLRVRDLIADQYRALRDIHAARDAKLAEVRPGGDATVAEAFKKAVGDATLLQLDSQHRKFLARLAAEITPDQIEQVKDGLTYGVVKFTYQGYLNLLPDLAAEHQREILAQLLEAREYAMDAGSSAEKHAWFGKYKGRINNYLSAAGIDQKQAEQGTRRSETSR